MASERAGGLGSKLLTLFFVVAIGVPTGCWALDRWFPDPNGSRIVKLCHALKEGWGDVDRWFHREALKGHVAEVRERKEQLKTDIEFLNARLEELNGTNSAKEAELRTALQPLVNEMAELNRKEQELVAAEADAQLTREYRGLDKTLAAKSDAVIRHYREITDLEAGVAAHRDGGRKAKVGARANDYLNHVVKGELDEAAKFCAGAGPTAQQLDQLVKLDPASEMGLAKDGDRYRILFGTTPVLLMIERGGEWYVGEVLVAAPPPAPKLTLGKK